MLPEYQRLDASKPLFLISFSRFCLRTVSLSLYSFLFCVIWSVVFDFERATSTHCHVTNYLPSISAAIGNYQPQCFVWQLAITLHAIPRFVIANSYHDRHKSLVSRSRWLLLAPLATLLNVEGQGILLEPQCVIRLKSSVMQWTRYDIYLPYSQCTTNNPTPLPL